MRELAVVMLAVLCGLLVWHSGREEPPKDPVCLDTYRRFYKNDTARVVVAFGYKDTRPSRFVGDRYERNFIAGELEQMGFSRDPNDDDKFTRAIPGPDGGRKVLEVQLVQSAAGPDDQENRKDPFQKWKTKRARQVFQNGLRTADAVIYNGHSRTGGGPDFGPPRLGKEDKVDYAWYQKTKPGVRELVASLTSEANLQLLGLFSCTAEAHFARELLKAKPHMALAASRQLVYAMDSLNGTLAVLKGLAEKKCEADFTPPHTSLRGFFKAAPIARDRKS